MKSARFAQRRRPGVTGECRNGALKIKLLTVAVVASLRRSDRQASIADKVEATPGGLAGGLGDGQLPYSGQPPAGTLPSSSSPNRRVLLGPTRE